MSPLALHAVFVFGGGLGAVARHWLARSINHRFPLSTLLVNVLGSLMLGAGLAAFAETGDAAGEGARRLVFGFCGGFTTFSSFAVQSIELHRDHSAVHVVANVALNLGLCLGALWAGGALVRA